MLRSLVIASLALTAAACASAPEPAAPAETVTPLTYEEFRPLLQAAHFNHKPEVKADAALTELAARSDITPSQKAEALYRRGSLRGIFIGDWPMAYPQCAMGDYLEALKLGPTESVKAQIMKDMQYQVSRRIYFNQAPFLGVPAECAAHLPEAQALVDAQL
ncbi:hypothetical protein K1X12_06765 [Hyphomonas sp. WL0036]|uniref:hypothetical protein n=1 Tax=Hyphomonas sediminis TaxID=2866160 RepID=UPI001C805F3C|nr:hypothetical protein [Hyphomonas sediminis]MBY9066594.1 hypothetical protein [Hyphomonas sediminis]